MCLQHFSCLSSKQKYDGDSTNKQTHCISPTSHIKPNHFYTKSLYRHIQRYFISPRSYISQAISQTYFVSKRIHAEISQCHVNKNNNYRQNHILRCVFYRFTCGSSHKRIDSVLKFSQYIPQLTEFALNAVVVFSKVLSITDTNILLHCLLIYLRISFLYG